MSANQFQKDFETNDTNETMKIRKIQERQLYEGGTKLLENSYKFATLFMRFPETNRKYLEYEMLETDDPFKFATDNIFTTQKVFHVTRNVLFYEEIHSNLQRLFESGFFKFLLPKYVEELKEGLKMKIHEKQEEYSTLTLEKLYPGFYVWLAALIVCFLVFIGEIIIS